MLILRLNKLVVGTFLPGTCQIYTFLRPFLVSLNLLPPLSHMLSESPIPFHPWNLERSILMYNPLDGSGIAKLGPDKISFFNRYINLCSSEFHRFCISSVSSFLDSVPS